MNEREEEAMGRNELMADRKRAGRRPGQMLFLGGFGCAREVFLYRCLRL